MKKIVVLLIIVFHAGFLFSQQVNNEFFSLTKIKEDVKSKRVGSWDQAGGNADCLKDIKDGDKVTIMDVEGAGVINHIWITIAPGADVLNRNDIVIRMFWDGNSYPSVESPIGPFFGNGWDETYNFVSAPLAVSPGWGKSYVSYFAMPFANGAKIEIENQSGVDISAFYFNIDYLELKEIDSDCGRFHAWYNHELTEALPDGENEWGVLGEQGKNLDGKGNYLFADIKGKGHFVGVNYYVNCPTTMWYGEGDEMVFIDGEKTPSIVGTGTEDFFNTSWCPKEIFEHPYFGYPRVNNETGWLGRTHVYRFMINDPFYFSKSCRFTIEHGHNNALTLDLASVAYWYQQNASPLPRSFSKEERKPMPAIAPAQIHLWRDSWRREHGEKSTLWGNEKKDK
ncbi:glycoside hydrolase family 172 protein [Sunxiuqinia sp. A32]|uniref:glycoside hydrolase family 172 protein n=1 Tax=Sunxiuqinia sp. A32 TaxID=3461496 RepID=UPI0040455AED